MTPPQLGGQSKAPRAHLARICPHQEMDTSWAGHACDGRCCNMLFSLSPWAAGPLGVFLGQQHLASNPTGPERPAASSYAGSGAGVGAVGSALRFIHHANSSRRGPRGIFSNIQEPENLEVTNSGTKQRMRTPFVSRVNQPIAHPARSPNGTIKYT